MNPVTRLKLGSVFFTVFWTGAMLWWSGAYQPANIVILSICGALAGYLWYRAMRWQFHLMGMLPRNEQTS
jgi:UDP-N-acetylmuramyl pentapeptide phosphotransferase/UDP-N-acetylglucosamine-1-phosphate transferase